MTKDNLLKASAKELFRTDLLHLTTKEQNKHREYSIDSHVLVHYRTSLPVAQELEGSNEDDQRIQFPLYTTGKEMDFHVSDMKPFVFDSAVVDPMDVARRDYMEYFGNTVVTQRSHSLCNLRSAG